VIKEPSGNGGAPEATAGSPAGPMTAASTETNLPDGRKRRIGNLRSGGGRRVATGASQIAQSHDRTYSSRRGTVNRCGEPLSTLNPRTPEPAASN
jgi:hypothetical protein